MSDDNDGPIYSMLTGKLCSGTAGYSAPDPNCPCKCLWLVGYNGIYVNDATSCPPGGSLNNNDPEFEYYTCYVNTDCVCTGTPSPPSAPGSIFSNLEPMYGYCNGEYGRQCGVCVEGECQVAPFWPE
jgi:hypothetical protein